MSLHKMKKKLTSIYMFNKDILTIFLSCKRNSEKPNPVYHKSIETESHHINKVGNKQYFSKNELEILVLSVYALCMSVCVHA